MKRSATATILILIMLLLVVAAGFVFLFQAELRFRDQLRALTADNDTLRAAQADAELELAGVQATRDATAAALATAQHESVLLEGQLVDSQQSVDALTEQMEQLTDEMDGLKAEMAELEGETQSQPPVVRIVAPLDEATLPLGQPVEIVLVASDATGLTSLTLEVDGARFTSYPIDGDRLYTRTLNWPAPATAGDHTFTATAVNLNGIRSEEQAITVLLRDTEAENAAVRAAVEANVSALRGLEPLEPIAPVVLTRDELRDRVTADFAADVTAEETRADVLALSAFDFMAPDYDLYGAQVRLQSEGILGFYDPETAEFVVVNDGALLDPEAQWTHAHEFVHALQDQHYQLDDLSDESLDSEARAAVRALAEGEAELVQYLYLFQGEYFTEEEAGAILSGGEEADGDFLSDLPPVLVSDLAFPYTSGVEFVADLYREDGFAAIDAAWANPPRSTEQILHPDRYRAGDAPQLVALAPLTDTLGVGWEQIDEDILGEFYLRQYLGQQLEEAAVERAATGWGGDRYAVYANEESGGLVMVLQLVWDTPADAEEFAAAYPLYPAARHDAEPQPQADGSTCWVGEEVICFRHSEGVSLIVRAPDSATAARVLAATGS
ncbi:Ig-like domain-containing protein [Promineifilum sp.]|uniref:Ig-like domain-containing protein n=1 Tax=Promineifilum sp. TaxID=2664178 RepID=UPI0035B1F235